MKDESGFNRTWKEWGLHAKCRRQMENAEVQKSANEWFVIHCPELF